MTNDTKDIKPTPAHDAPALVGGEVTTLFGDPVIRGHEHHVQSITPIPTVPSTPISKRRTKNWWKRLSG